MEKNEMEITYQFSFVNLSQIITDNKLSPPARLLLVILIIKYARNNNNAFPTKETLAKDIGCSSRHIHNLLQELKDCGVTTWERRGFSKSNKYSFNNELYFLNDKTKTVPYKKNTSSQVGNTVPKQTGNVIPPKVNHESNHIESSQLLRLFEKANKEFVSEIERRRFINQIANYNPTSVEKAIKIAISRNKLMINTAYIVSILNDWQINGEPQPAPIFQPCNQNGCDRGSIFNFERNTYSICKCKKEFDMAYQKWKKEFGNSYQS